MGQASPVERISLNRFAEDLESVLAAVDRHGVHPGRFTFEGERVRAAIRATFDRRGTPIPDGPPLALTDAFASDPTKQTQWKAFLSRSRITESSLTLPEVIGVIGPFVLPELEHAVSGSATASSWEPGGPWRRRALRNPEDQDVALGVCDR